MKPTQNLFRAKASSAVLTQLLGAATLWLLGCSLTFASCVGPAPLRAAIQSRPNAQAYADLGNWFAGQKQFDCAAQSFASAAGLQPDSTTLVYLWGLSLSSAGHDAESLGPLHHAAALDPTDIRAHLALGAALDRLKQTANAEAEWRKALAIDADSAPALDGLSQDLIGQMDYTGVVALLDKPSGSRERSATQSLDLGLAFAGTARFADELALVLMLLGREDEAYAVFDLALQKHPDDQTTQLLYLHALVSSHSDKASGYARGLLEKYPRQWEVLYLNAVLETADGNSQQARAHLELSVALDPKHPESQEALGNVLTQRGDLPGAKLHLEKAIALGDSSPEAHYMLAKVLQGLGDNAQAKESLRIYQKLKDAQTGKAQAAGKAEGGDQAMAAGHEAQAASLYREALESDPGQPLLLYKLAKALDKMNDVAGEKTQLQRAIQVDPNLAEAQNQMGYLVVREGDTAQAETYFRAAVHASPSYVAAWINLAATLASESRWDDAKQALDHALEIDPDNIEARRLGQAIAEARSKP
jgi:tetratricopeptide (TPR) repeat protein